MKTNNQINYNHSEVELLGLTEVLYTNKDFNIIDEIIDVLAESLLKEWDKTVKVQAQTALNNIETMINQLANETDSEKFDKLNKRIKKAQAQFDSGETLYEIKRMHAERNSVDQFEERIRAALPQSVVEDVRRVYLVPSFTWLADFEATGCSLKGDRDKANLLFSKHTEAVNWKYDYKNNSLSLISSSVPHIFVSSPYSEQAKIFNDSLLKEASTCRYVLTYEIVKNDIDVDNDDPDDLFAILGETKAKYSVVWHVYDRANSTEVPIARAAADVVNADKAISTVLELVNPSQKTNWLAMSDKAREGLKALMKADAYEVLAAKLLWLAKNKCSDEIRLEFDRLRRGSNGSFDLRFTGWAYSSDKAAVQRIANILRDHDIDVSNPKDEADKIKVALCAMTKIED